MEGDACCTVLVAYFTYILTGIIVIRLWNKDLIVGKADIWNK